MPRKGAEFKHVTSALLTLLKAEREGRVLSVTEFLKESDIPSTTFYGNIRDLLTSYGFVEIVANPRERMITVKLTERGRKLAVCLEEIGIGKDLGAFEEPEEEEASR
jgi:DNA-binding MarR family transcriptional regulator